MLKGNKTLVRSIILGLLVVVLSVTISNQLSKPSSKQIPKISFRTKTVTVKPVSLDVNTFSVEASGRLKAFKRFDIIAEVNGVLLNESFREGNQFKYGETLVKMNDEEIQVQIKAQKSTLLGLLSQVLPDIQMDYKEDFEIWKSFTVELNPSKALPSLPSINNPKLKQLLASRNILNSYYTIEAQEIRLSKYNMITPFSGVLSEALIEPGSLVRAGQKIGTFVQPGIYEVETSVTPEELIYLKKSSNIQLFTDAGKSVWGTISRINEVVEGNTQLVSVYLKVNDKRVREGQFLRTKINGASIENSFVISRDLINEDGTIFTVNMQDSSLEAKPVKIYSVQGEEALVTGLNEGDMLPLNTISGAFNAMKVVPSIIVK